MSRIGRRAAMVVCFGLALADFAWLNTVFVPRALSSPAAHPSSGPLPGHALPEELEPAPAVVDLAAVAPAPAAPATTLLFAVGRSQLGASQVSSRLRPAIEFLRTHRDFEATVEGHGDSTGGPAFNLALSAARAGFVAGQLQQSGIAASRIEIRAFGDTRPRVTGNSETQLRQNRRVEVTLRRRAS